MVSIDKKRKNNGWALTELIVSISILTVIMACLSSSLNTFRIFNKYQLARQQCVAAAQAQIESIAATGDKISDENNKRLWPDIKISIEHKDGSGDWLGLELITVTTCREWSQKTISAQLARYMPIQNIKQETD